MTNTTLQQTDSPQFNAFIKENTPALEDLTAVGERNPSTHDSMPKIPRKLQSHEEDLLLETAFRYLFHLNAARETHAAFDVEKLAAIEGNRLVKKKHPLNVMYDFLYVSAKTRIQGYVKREPYTVPYQRMALKIYGACFLFAQLDLVAQTGVVPDKLGTRFYFLPKGTFVDEFEQLNEMALWGWLSTLSTNDTVQFHPAAADAAKGFKPNGFLLNDCFIKIDTSEASTSLEEALEESTHLFFLQKIHEAAGSASAIPAFSKVGFYRARYGEMKQLDLEAYFGNSLDALVKEAAKNLA